MERASVLRRVVDRAQQLLAAFPKVPWTDRVQQNTSTLQHPVALYRSEELSSSIIRVTRIGEPETTLAVTSNRRTLRRNIMSHSCS
jgi:hypothetical protein